MVLNVGTSCIGAKLLHLTKNISPPHCSVYGLEHTNIMDTDPFICTSAKFEYGLDVFNGAILELVNIMGMGIPAGFAQV
jgi:hypothetical protein